ncbi:MAG TPA: hypothetical protein VGQ59_11810, partial [Cyclobacteriaceae bacterium]|nr:hypothetical protein [Cyclobacteriaceae bacterium]
WLPFIVLLLGCHGQRSDQSVKGELHDKSNSSFYELLEQLPAVKIPLTFRSDREFGSPKINDDLRARLMASDEGFNPYGKVYQSDKFIAVIAIGAADIVMPVLVTFNKEGRIIDSFNLYQTAGGDIGYYSTNITRLTKDKEILMTDSAVTRKLNKEGTDEVPGSDSVTISQKKFRINANGGIEEMR